MKTSRRFVDGDRYRYDFGKCIDTWQEFDAQGHASGDLVEIILRGLETNVITGDVTSAITLANAAPDLLAALEEAERALRWAAQESKGRVKAEIVGGWLHHADAARAAIAKARGE